MEKQQDEIYCPNCAKPIKKDFTVCPYCRSEIKKEKEEFYNPETATEVQKLKVDNSNKGKSIAAIITVLLVVGLIIGFVSCCIGSGTSSTPTTKSEQSLEIEAFVGSQMVVEDNLKSPSSAKFPLYTDSKVSVKKIAENKYSVSAYVDSENSFGAMIRNYYTCTVTLLDNDRYRVEDLKFYE